MSKVSEYRKTTATFQYYNPNPLENEKKRWDRGDCVIRAFAVALDLTWIEAYDILCEEARKTYNVPNDDKVYDAALKARGCTYVGCKPEQGKKRMTVEEFCKAHPKGRFFVNISGHCTAVVDGVCYDTWNPARHAVTRYYKVDRL